MHWLIPTLLYMGALLLLQIWLKRRNVMEKYGVEVPEEKTKHGSAGECSECGGKLDMNSNPPKCPACGFEPQEKRKE